MTTLIQEVSTIMKIISLINSKGGVGKTTLSVSLAAYLRNQNKKVLLVDADPQGSLRDWKDAGNETNDFELTIADRRQVLLQLPKLIKKSGYDFVIVDTVGKMGDLMGVSIAVSDVILIPVQPSPYDIWALNDVMELINLRKTINPNLLSYVVINSAMPKTLMSKYSIQDLKTAEMPMLESIIQQRVVYSQSACDGQSIYDFKNEDAKEEINKLGEEVLKKINEHESNKG